MLAVAIPAGLLIGLALGALGGGGSILTVPALVMHRTGDVFKHLERMRQRKRVFDLVVVDPPPFSTVGGTTFSASVCMLAVITA